MRAVVHPEILTADDLQRATGYDRDGDVTRLFDQQGIRWFPGKGGRPWTTIALINLAGGLYPQQHQARQLGPDDV